MPKKIRYGSADPFAKYEEAAGITPAPSPLSESAPATGFTAPEWTGPRPWRGESVPSAPAAVPAAPKRSMFKRAADYLSGANAFREMAPRNASASTGGMLAGRPSGSSPLIPLSSIPEQQKRSLRGSPPFTPAEMKQGYRKMGAGFEKNTSKKGE